MRRHGGEGDYRGGQRRPQLGVAVRVGSDELGIQRGPADVRDAFPRLARLDLLQALIIPEGGLDTRVVRNEVEARPIPRRLGKVGGVPSLRN